MTQDAIATSILGDRDYLDLKSYIITTTGLSYFAQKDEDLAGRIARRMSIIGLMSCLNYKVLLGSSSAQGSEFDHLVTELTIGETFFFRHSEQFDALRNVVLPKLIEQNQATRKLRIWCAGCSTGAEPYTLSIILRHEFRVMLAGWTIEIVATDINRNFLQRATDGDFDDWHLRILTEEQKNQWFRRREKDRGWLINEEFKKGMRFVHHNLISGKYPPQPESNELFDVIFCRNVMIYFDAATVASIVPRFDQCMNPAGFLFLGYSEINTQLYKAFEVVSYPGALLFRKKNEASFALPTASIFTFPVNGLVPQPLKPAPPPPLPFPEVSSIPPQIDAPKAIDPYAKCREHANRGDFQKALKFADELVLMNSLDAKAQFFRGVCQWQLLNLASAEESFKKAVYIDRKFTLAHYHLALIYRKLGDTSKSSRYLINAAELIKEQNGAERVMAGEDMTVHQLTQLIKTMKDAS